MNNIDAFFKFYKDRINDMDVKQGPTEDEIYNKLCSYQSKHVNVSDKVIQIVNFVEKYIKDYIKNCSLNKREIDINYINKNKGEWLKCLNVYFDTEMPGVSEQIKIYLSLKPELYVDVSISIYNYLMKNHISFESTISKMYRNDNFVISLYSKDDVINLIKFLKHNRITNNLNPLNPFIYQDDNIGVVKEVRDLNYNQYTSKVICDYIEECILNQQLNPYTAFDFQNYIASVYEKSTGYQNKNMSYNLACSIHSIITNDNLIDRFNYKYMIELDLNYLSLYQSKLDKLKNQEEVKDELELIKLNALNCIYQIYVEKYNEIPSKNFKLNSRFINKILKQIELLLLDNSKCNIICNFKNKNISILIPYLYSFVALKYKKCNIEEAKKIIDKINTKMIILKEENDNMYIYELNKRTINSSVPIIESSNGCSTIEYIDLEDNVANINVIYNGKVDTYLNVYLDVDKLILKNNKNHYGRLYRNAIGNALLDKDRNNKALDERKNNFTAIFLSDSSKEVNQYVNVSIIKQIFLQKQ